MEKLYTEADLISFGKYLLSEERKENILLTKELIPESLDPTITYTWVHDADLSNWKTLFNADQSNS